jgi:ABC-type sugar transport system permease subunit
MQGFLILLPSIALYALLMVYPLINTIFLSFFRWNGFAPIKEFLGLANYHSVITDPRIWKALLRNVVWSALSIFPLILGLILAVLIFQRKLLGRKAFRVIFFLPHMLSLAIVGVIWKWIYQPEWGTLNKILLWIGLKPVGWLGNPSTVLVALITVGSWTYYGFCMVIFLSGLQQIPVEYYESAYIDGANAYHCFFYITIPQLRNQITMLIMLTVIWSFKVFDLVFIMTGGGPYGTSEVIGFLIYVKAFQQQNIGYSTAASTFLFFIVVTGSIFFLKYRERTD